MTPSSSGSLPPIRGSIGDYAKITKIIAASAMNVHMIEAANNHMSRFGKCCLEIVLIAIYREWTTALTVWEVQSFT